MTSKRMYSLHTFDQQAMLRQTNGTPIEDTSQMRQAAEALLNTADHVDQMRGVDASYDMDQFKHDKAQGFIDQYLTDPRMVWVYEPQAIAETATLDYPLVYFAVSPTDFIGSIKVGYTYKLAKRMPQIKEEYKMTSTPYPIAIAQLQIDHDNASMICRSLEYWLHVYLNQHRVVSEWFKAAPVQWLIYHYKHLYYERGYSHGPDVMQEVF